MATAAGESIGVESLTLPSQTTTLPLESTETPSSSPATPPKPEQIAQIPQEQRPPLCKHWSRSKTCLYHAKGKCRFDHPPDYVIPPPQPPKNGRRRSSQTDLSHRLRSAGGRLQTRNDARVAILRAFLADTLKEHGIPDLSSFNVLDVAGGKGELAFQLLNLNNVSSCHVIDPRPLSLGRFQKRRHKGFYHRSQGILQTDVVRSLSEPERPVDQLRCLFSSELWEEGESNVATNEDGDGDETKKCIDDDDNIIDDCNQGKTDNYRKQRAKFFENSYKAKGWVWPPVGSANEHASCSKNYDDRDDVATAPIEATNSTIITPSEAEDASNSNFANATHENTAAADAQPDTTPATTPSSPLGIAFDHASSVVKTADLIVGMHPDQAAGAIIDAALYQNISFFVVPCCVFSREFPHRRVCVPVPDASGDAAENKTKMNGFGPTFVSTMKLVTTYPELIDYLQAKSPEIKRHVLPFEGRNVCLYRVVPPRASEGDEPNKV